MLVRQSFCYAFWSVAMSEKLVWALSVIAATAIAQTPGSTRNTTTRPRVYVDDIEPIVTKLIVQQGKSEFESTEQYQARLRHAIDPQKDFCFRIIKSDFHLGARFEYDADDKTMHLSLESGMEPSLLQAVERPIVLDVKHVVRSSRMLKK